MKFDNSTQLRIWSRDGNSFYNIEGKKLSFTELREIICYGLEHPGSVTIKIHSKTLQGVTNCYLELIDMDKGD